MKLTKSTSNWVQESCGNCRGFGIVESWNGIDADVVDCDGCGGAGYIFLHVPSGTYADYPGGPLRGSKYGNKRTGK